MHHKTVEPGTTNQFAPVLRSYLSGDKKLSGFYNNTPSLEGILRQLGEKKFCPEHRKILCQVLKNQYSHININEQVGNNIGLLEKEDTYTITTGHQLNIFTGPLYFIYKIVSVINACRQLKEAKPEANFVPVYWMATEDHDFEEIAHFRFEGIEHYWKSDQAGAVGRMKPEGLKAILDEIPGLPQCFNEAYLKHDNLADAVRYYINALFEDYGLVVINADESRLKKLFNPVIKDDLLQHSAKKLVDGQSVALENLGYKTQVYCRDINFFYLEQGLRERIVKEGEWYKVQGTELKFTADEIIEEVDNHPEKFSPNVILRPLYQECILPNLAYCGGPSEVVYWLQLKPVFDHFKIPYPVVMPRNFAMIIPRHIKRKMAKLNIADEDIFKNKHQLQAQLVAGFAGHELDLNGKKDEILATFESIKKQAAAIDPTLAPHVEAQQTKTKNSLEVIEKKFIRAEKKNQQVKLDQLESVLQSLLPNGMPQERADNFLNFYMEDPKFIDELIMTFDPFDFSYNILTDG